MARRPLGRRGEAGALPPHPLVRPLRGRTTKEGPHKRARPLFGNTRALEAGGGSDDRSPGPARQPALAPGLSNARGGFCRVQPGAPPLKNAVELGCLHETYQRIAASVRHEREAGGQGRLSCRVRGPIRRRSGLERAGFENREKFGSRLWRSIALVEGIGTRTMTGTEAPPSPICPPSVPLPADRRIRAERARGRGPGPAVVPGPGTYSATEWAGARRL
jgi:hypothetical protein